VTQAEHGLVERLPRRRRRQRVGVLCREGEVLIRVRTSSINGFDGAVAAGMLKGMMEHRFPVSLGKDFAGVVEALGEGASRFAVGDEVFGVVMKPYLGDGGLGEYLVVGEQYGSAKVPSGLDLQTAGALGLAGSAARDSLDALAPAAGELTLVSGATGGVGALALQYAAAEVIATARPGAEADFVRGLGAAHVADYSGDLDAQVRAVAPDGVPAVLHLAGDPAQLTGLLGEGGRLASTLGFGPDQHPAAIAVMAGLEGATLDRLAADAASGAIRVPIAHIYPLDEAPQALADFAAPGRWASSPWRSETALASRIAVFGATGRIGRLVTD
jgi:NADPH:quinone reductase-like Zn-dependent oxidoreductase